MKRESDQLLCEHFPLLYKNRRGDPTKTPMHWGFSVGDGWFKIIYDLSLKLEILVSHWISSNPHVCETCDIQESEHNAENALACKVFKLDHPNASQVKEKFGGLRFYMDGANEEMSKCIVEAESQAYKTCEVCGEPGNQDGEGWIKTKCEKCRSSNARAL